MKLAPENFDIVVSFGEQTVSKMKNLHKSRSALAVHGKVRAIHSSIMHRLGDSVAEETVNEEGKIVLSTPEEDSR